ncbi:MAG: TRZ/ATZ family hydrolase [Porticoccaceae bacterium]
MSSPIAVDKLISASWIIPIVPANTVLSECAVAIDNGKIVDLCTQREAALKYAPREHIELPGQLLMPGLINSHSHSAMTLLRGYADDLPLERWLADAIWPAESQLVCDEFVAVGTRLALAEMIASGTTSFADMYFFPEATARESASAGLRALLAAPIFDGAGSWGQDADDYIHKTLKLRDNYKSHSLVEIAFGPHAPYSCSDTTIQKVATFAQELDMAVMIHLHETEQEIAQAVAANGQRPIERLAELGLFGPRTLCVHMTTANDEELATLQKSGSHIVHCPSSNLKLASGIAPVAHYQSAGVNVAIGTDGAASNNSLDLFAELRLAALLGKAASADAAAIDCHRALRMATLDGARALGWEHKTGSLETGKEADLIAIDLSSPAQQPLYNPASQLVYTAVGGCVSHSWVAGQCLLRDGQLTTINQRQLQREVTEKWQPLIAALEQD